MEIYNNLDMQQNQIINVVLHSQSTPPGSPANGQIWHNSTSNIISYYRLSDSTWVPLGSGTVVGGDGLLESTTGGIVTLSVNVDNTTLAITSDVVGVKDGGITAIKLATDAVTTLKILNQAVTFAKLQNINAMTVIGRTAAGAGVASEITLINDNTLASATGTNIATAGSVKAYIDSLVGAVGTLVGAFNASTSTNYPGSAAIKKGAYWYVSVAGTVQGTAFNVGDVLIANKDNPSTTLAADWIFLETNRDQATATVLGLVMLATAAEVQTGTDAVKAVTPATLSARTATETRTGLMEIATQAETDAGTDDTRAITPLKLATYVAARIAGGAYAATIGDGTATAYTVTHNLNTLDVVVEVRKVSDNSSVIVDNRASTVNAVIVTFAKAPAAGAFRVIIKK
ncbi:hypothetical protein [Dyadobacter fermentans]|uniref:hypothetical protein n=1 Tax=Dyadobacter fermentans TaxID=94254 RepID=UPI001CBC60FE|nr:hypothetical protein [Dyadobacter fermentans]MBZ1362023.1 hypothetical protein [Dyadobacter fermentans]